QGRGLQVHRGRLRRPRRRLDGARPRRDGGLHAARRGARAAAPARARQRRGAPARRAPPPDAATAAPPRGAGRPLPHAAPAPPPAPEPPADNATRESLRKLMREGKLDDKMVEIDTADSPTSFVDVFSGTGMEEMVLNLRDMLPQGSRKTKRRRLPLPEALE